MYLTNVQCFRYKLPVTITDESGSLDALAFSFVAEDLVELDAAQASQNMKIDPADHPTTLNNAIGKTKIFAIGMNTDTSSKFPISYVLKKSFTIEPTMSVPMLTDGEVSKYYCSILLQISCSILLQIFQTN